MSLSDHDDGSGTADDTLLASGDTIVDDAPLQTTIEANGGTSLVKLFGQYFLDAVNGLPGPQLNYNGSGVVEGQFFGWKPIGVEQTASGYQVAWKMAGQDQYVIWHADSQGNWASQTALVSGGSLALQSLEPAFHQDLNGDGITGVRMVEIELQGSTTLSHAADGYAMQAAGGTSDTVLVKYLGADVTEGQFGDWKAIAAEQTATGFDVAWKMDGQDQYILWHIDAQGNWLGQTAPMSGTNAALQVSEFDLHARSQQRRYIGTGYVGSRGGRAA